MAHKNIKVSTTEVTGNDFGIPGDLRKLMNESGPFVLDSLVRQAFMMCWMLLPENKRSAKMVVDALTRLFERNAKNFLADSQLMGIGSEFEAGTVLKHDD